jgi:hypothetical protein
MPRGMGPIGHWNNNIYYMCCWHQWPFMPWMIFRIFRWSVYQHHYEWNSFITIHFSFTMYEVFFLCHPFFIHNVYSRRCLLRFIEQWAILWKLPSTKSPNKYNPLQLFSNCSTPILNRTLHHSFISFMSYLCFRALSKKKNSNFFLAQFMLFSLNILFHGWIYI